MISPDIRLACGQSEEEPEAIPFLFGCTQEQTSTSSIFIKENVTVVPNYSASGTPPYIAPYGRPSERILNCSPYDDYECGDGINGNLFCDAPPTSAFAAGTSSIMSGSGTAVAFSTGKYTNWYVETDRTQSMPACNEVRAGWKAVYGSKCWNGYTTLTAGSHGGADVFNADCSCAYLLTNEPVTTKYLTLDIVATVTDVHVQEYRVNDGTTRDCGTCGFDCGQKLVNIRTWTDSTSAHQVSSLSTIGNYTTTCTSASSYNVCGPENGAFHHIIGSSSADICNGRRWITEPETGCCGDESTGSACMQAAATASINYQENSVGLLGSIGALHRGHIFGLYCATNPGAAPDIVDGDLYPGGPRSMTVTWNTTHYSSSAGVGIDCIDKTYFTVPLVISTVTPTSLTSARFGILDDYEPANCPGTGFSKPWGALDTVTYTFTPTSLNYTRVSYSGRTPSGYSTRTSTVVVTLSNPYTYAQARDEASSLLQYWDMGDNLTYPLRTDQNLNVGPWVHLDEGGAGGPSAGSCTSNYTGSTGAILGKPADPSLDRIWNATFPNYCTCEETTDSGDCDNLFINTVGRWSSEAPTGVPRNATDWIDSKRANMLPQGAFIALNAWLTPPASTCEPDPGILHDDVVWVCKYMECLATRPSISFGRPCNTDRLQVSQSMARCVHDADTSNPMGIILNIDPTATPIPDDLFNFNGWVCGVSGVVDGLYPFTVGDPHIVITTGPMLYSASWVADLDLPMKDCGSGMVAPLWWNDYLSIPGICGKSTVTHLTVPNSASMVTCSLEASAVLFDLEEVRIEDASGATWDVNGTWGIIAVNSSSIALIGSEGITPVDYNGRGLASIPFSNEWRWHDSSSKGDYSSIQWSFDFRARQEYVRRQAIADYYNFTVPELGCIIDAPEPFGQSQITCGYDGNLKSVEDTTDCLAVSPCSSRIVFFAPAGQDNFPESSSANMGWGDASANYDQQYGGLWQGIVKQNQDDIFWQPPACPCSYDGETDEYSCDVIWRMDNGSCQGDADNGFGTLIRYYPQPASTEARSEIPEGAPDLAPGVKLGCAPLNDCSNPHKNVCNAPSGDSYDWIGRGCDPYFPHVWNAPWVTYTNRQNCVCATGSFAPEYIKQGTVCPD